MQRLRWKSLVEVVPLPVRRAAVDRQDRRPRPAVRQGHGGGLEERHVGVAPAGVAGGGRQQAREQRRGHQRLLRRHRVRQTKRLPPLVGGVQPECVELRRPDEGEADHLDVAGTGQGAADPAPQPLPTRQTATGRRCGEHRGHVDVADDPGDLLDEVEGVGEVGTPRRRRRREGDVGAVDRAAHRLEVLHDGGRVDRHAGHPRGQVVGHLDRRRPGRRADHCHAGLGRAAAVRRQQLDDPVGRGLGDRRVDATLVALAGLGGDLVATAGAEHRDRVPRRHLDEHARRGRRHLGLLAAHHAAQADRARVVGDHEVLAGQRAVHAVERREVLSLCGPPDPHRAGELVQVVAVDRVAHLEHHVVGDVDGQGDRSHAGELDAPGHPARCRRRRVEPGHRPRHEDAAALEVVDLDRVAVRVGRRRVPQGRVAEGHAVRQGRLACHPAQRQRVGPVRVDLELDDLVAQRQHGEGVIARLARIGRQHDDAVVVVAEAELRGRADHPGRDVTVGLAGADLEAAGEHAAGQHDHDEVAHGEVVRSADDALRLAGAVGGPDVDRAPADRLAVGLRLVDERQDASDHERAGDVVAGPLQRLELQPEGGEPRRRGPRRRVRRAGPRSRGSTRAGHARAQISVPKAVEKRTSPSNMLRRSAMPCRNIRVRSMPMPKAKPV